jgi:hypothetical protein
MQKKAIRIIAGVKYNEHTSPIFKSLNILKLQELYDLQLAKFMYLQSKRELPQYLMSIFTPIAEVHNYETRQQNNPHIRYRRTLQAGRSIVHKGPEIWHSLSDELRNKPTIKSFSNTYKKTLFANY